MTLLRACRVTPRILAPSEIDNPKGSRHALRMLRPGCGGFFMVMGVFSFSLVVVDQFNIESIFSLKSENDAPVCAYRHRPETAQSAFKRMEAIAGKVKGLRRRGLIETTQNVFDVVHQIRPYAAPVVAFKEPFQAPVFEASDHRDTP